MALFKMARALGKQDDAQKVDLNLDKELKREDIPLFLYVLRIYHKAQ